MRFEQKTDSFEFLEQREDMPGAQLVSGDDDDIDVPDSIIWDLDGGDIVEGTDGDAPGVLILETDGGDTRGEAAAPSRDRVEDYMYEELQPFENAVEPGIEFGSGSGRGEAAAPSRERVEDYMYEELEPVEIPLEPWTDFA